MAAVVAAERVIRAEEHTSIVARSVEGWLLKSPSSYSQNYIESQRAGRCLDAN